MFISSTELNIDPRSLIGTVRNFVPETIGEVQSGHLSQGGKWT